MQKVDKWTAPTHNMFDAMEEEVDDEKSEEMKHHPEDFKSEFIEVKKNMKKKRVAIIPRHRRKQISRDLSPPGSHIDNMRMPPGLTDDINLMEDGEGCGELNAVKDTWEWKCIEAAVDSAAFDNVANPKDFPGIEVNETEESKRGEHWTCAGGKKIPKHGNLRVPWQSNDGEVRKHINFKASAVNRTLISADRLAENGYEVILNRKSPRIVHETSGEMIRLERIRRFFILKMWVRVKADAHFRGQGSK